MPPGEEIFAPDKCHIFTCVYQEKAPSHGIKYGHHFELYGHRFELAQIRLDELNMIEPFLFCSRGSGRERVRVAVNSANYFPAQK